MAFNEIFFMFCLVFFSIVKKKKSHFIIVGFFFSTDKSPSSTAQVKESMDLYEEFVTEEQQSKEKSYTEVR